MDINYGTVLVKLVLAVALAALIGYERETRKVSVKGTAGLRTHMLVSLGSALITLIALDGFSGFINADIGRINVIGYVVMGIGFLGAGTIIANKGEIIGLTTAASIWLVAAIGIAVGLGLYVVALITTLIALVVLELWRFEKSAEY
jgi:putative Mg2+ transporter-C (MgtC) family protein